MKVLFEVIVKDSGSGMPEEEAQKIQIAFDQLSGDTTDTVNAGLSLSINRLLIRKMGGRLRVESQLEKGSSFTILLQTECMMT